MRLIDANELKELRDKYIRGEIEFDDEYDLIDRCPTIDAVLVVHGRWVRPHWKNSNYCCVCSECGGEAMHRDYQWNKNGIYPICPNCGAKMDKETGVNDDYT